MGKRRAAGAIVIVALSRQGVQVMLRIWPLHQMLRRLQKDGWQVARIRGSHRVLHHQVKPGIVVVPGRPGDEIPPGTLKAIFKQAQVRE